MDDQVYKNSPEYAKILNNALAEITKTPLLTSGILTEAAKVVARIGCTALNTTRIGIWRINHVTKHLDNVISYTAPSNDYTIQESFSFSDRPQYTKLLSSERMIVIDNAKTDSVLANLADTYSPELASMLDIPIRLSGVLAGVVCVEHNDVPRIWTPAEQLFSASLADLAGLAMESSVRRQALIDLDNTKRQTSALMANLPGMVYRCLNDPPEFTFTFVSDGCRQLVGYTPDELMHNNSLKFFDMVHPDDVGPLAQLNKETLEIGLPLDTTFRMIMKDGTIKWIWERSRVVEKYPDGSPHILEGFYTDITEQRRLETSELAHKEKAKFTNAMSKRLQDAMDVIVSLVKEGMDSGISDQAKGYLQQISNSADGLLGIVENMIDASNIEAGVVNLNPAPYSLDDLLEHIDSVANRYVAGKQVDFRMEKQSDLPMQLEGDSKRIKQVVSNLLDNILRQAEKGSFLMQVAARPVKDSDQVLLSFNMHSVDINPSFAESTTLSFSDADEIGLGLSASKILAERMGGDITIETTLGKNTAFKLELIQRAVK